MVKTRRLVALAAAITLLVPLALALAGCRDPGDRAARQTYNDALVALEGSDLDAAVAKLLAARDDAGQDPELRFRAAYNLGIAYARQADAAADPEARAELLRRSAGWFRDAVSLRPDDDGPRTNLEVVLRRLQLLADELNRGDNGLEARLDRLIEDQRGIRDRIRQLMTRVAQAGAGAEPVAFATEFEAIATAERALLAEAGTVSDMAGEEMALLEGKPDEEQTDADQMRLAQLRSLDRHLHSGRTALADARRALRRLRGDSAHRRADAALADLKRAREQLLDPIAILQQIAGDEAGLAEHTGALVALASGAIRVGDDAAAPPQAPPPWLTAEHLAERQQEIRARLSELVARLRAGVEANAAAPPEDPQAAHLLASAADALPFLDAADEAMGQAAEALAAGRATDGLAAERRALEALARAIERFAGVKQLIELTYRDQRGMVTLMTPPAELGEDAPPLPELSTAERTRLITEALAQNRDRLARLRGALTAELAEAEARAGGHQPGGQQPGAADADQALEGLRQTYAQAEVHRAAAAAKLEELADMLAAANAGRRFAAGEGPRVPAQAALEEIEALRRLFFSIVEHLQQLLRDQSQTHDDTATAHGATDDQRAALLGPLAGAQQSHAELGEALAQALEEQADAAGQAPDPQAAQAGQRFAEAAVEVRSATAAMQAADGTLGEALAMAGVASYDLEPTLGSQSTAMEHLARAIQILQPPPPEQDQDQDQDQDQSDQGQGQDQQQQLSQQEAQRRLQAIRDREAERDRERRRRQQVSQDPVEKDW